MGKVEFGVRLPVAGPLATPEGIKRTAQRAEQLEFDALWVHDFIAWTTFQDRTHVSCGSVEAVEAANKPPIFFESLTNLAFLAGITQRIRLGVAVLCLPYRNPVVAAKQVANIDVLSNGRLILGVGTGAPKSTHNVDFEVLGVSRTTKYEMTRDYVRAMKAIWTMDRPEYQGEFISFPATEIYPKPVQKPHPPLWVGGGSDKAVEFAAEFCSGWLPPWISPDQYPARIEALKTMAQQKGRGDVDFDIATEVIVCVDQSSQTAQRNAARTVGILPEGFAADATPTAVLDAGLIGSPQEVNEKLDRYIKAGVRHYEMKFIYRSVDHLLEQLDLFSREIMPAHRAVAV
jgi:probable F420-dependent oxidoreductase